MKNTFKYLLPVLLVSVALVKCKKDDPQLQGDASTADFDFVQSAASDTLPYVYRLTFTNKSKGEFLYQWNFGDGSALASEKSPVHTYTNGGVYDIGLTTVGTNGNNFISKRVNVTSACGNDVFNKLTACNSKDWTWSLAGDAIKVLAPDGTTVYYSGGVSGCQADDVYSFGADGKFTYNANGQTFDVQAGYSCQAPKANAPKFKLVVKAGLTPQIILDSIATGKPFIGTTDVVVGNKYDIRAYDDNNLTLRGVIANTGGQFIEIKLRKVAPLTLADVKMLLTGGSTKSWKLDGSNGANAIVVGTEANPAAYFGGGAIDDCQKDDKYTFSMSNSLVYASGGSTFNGGNIAPNYTCGNDRSYTVTYTFGAVAGGVAGLAGIQLPGVVPATFIGTTDIPTENYYRIIDITANQMLLRAGNGSGTVFQFKMIPY
ncbi:MAG: hypothetical protein EOO61_09840 [Hymenobacter sp.]|nr:MAG: hypothetical protein EOO61_09840 [Hymenobacter sp.]